MGRYFEVKAALAKEPTNRALRREFKELKKDYEFLEKDFERSKGTRRCDYPGVLLRQSQTSQIRRFPDQSMGIRIACGATACGKLESEGAFTPEGSGEGRGSRKRKQRLAETTSFLRLRSNLPVAP